MFSKNTGVYAIFNDQSFNDMLTNDFGRFEQLGPGSFDMCLISNGIHYIFDLQWYRLVCAFVQPLCDLHVSLFVFCTDQVLCIWTKTSLFKLFEYSDLAGFTVFHCAGVWEKEQLGLCNLLCLIYIIFFFISWLNQWFCLTGLQKIWTVFSQFLKILAIDYQYLSKYWYSFFSMRIKN